jgi:hypothetical protein
MVYTILVSERVNPNEMSDECKSPYTVCSLVAYGDVLVRSDWFPFNVQPPCRDDAMKTAKWKYPKIKENNRFAGANNVMFSVETALDNGVEFSEKPQRTVKARVEVINGKKFYVM